MATYKFFNIGKANAEIDRLQLALDAANAAKPDATISTQLQEALASNETISGQLTQANSDLIAAKASIASLTAEKTALETNHKTAMTNLEASVADKAAKRAQEIQAGLGSPAAPAVDPAAKPAEGKTGLSRLVSAAAADLSRAGYVSKNK